MTEKKRGKFLKWDKSLDEAVSCLAGLAYDANWRIWQQDEGDTRSIVHERAGAALRGNLATLRTENERLRAFVKQVATITDSGDYDFHDVPYDLVKSARELLASLASKTEGERDGG